MTSGRDRIAEALERETFVVTDAKLRNLLHEAAALLRASPVGEQEKEFRAIVEILAKHPKNSSVPDPEKKPEAYLWYMRKRAQLALARTEPPKESSDV